MSSKLTPNNFPLLGCDIEWQKQPDENWKLIIYGTLIDRETKEEHERWVFSEENISKTEYFRRKLCGEAHGKVTKWQENTEQQKAK